MSKIVLLEAQLSTTRNMNKMLDELRIKDPALANLIKGLDVTEVIGECVQKAFEILKSQGVEISGYVLDYNHNKTKSFDGQKIVGALKTPQLPNGLGIIVTDNFIRFVADEYKSEWKEEISRLKAMFTNAYLLEVAKASLEIMGYNVQPTEIYGRGDEQSFNITGMKAGV